MRNMFTMMNAARIGVGMEGLAISERAYQQALAFAQQRVQGRAVGSSEEVAIVEHPDVRRMLMTMKSYIEAMRALVVVTAQEGDYAVHGESEPRKQRALDLLALLTPVVKAWCTDVGVELTSLGIQVHGGMGYVEETGAAQHFRDSRIAPIYEGTNGIQAIDLVTRKLPMRNGEVVRSFITEMTRVLDEMDDHPELGSFRTELSTAIKGLADTSTWLGERMAAGDVNDALAGATAYLTQLGTVAGGWLMAKAAVAALSNPTIADPGFLTEKVNTARFYGEHLLPKANGLISTITAGNSLLENASLTVM